MIKKTEENNTPSKVETFVVEKTNKLKSKTFADYMDTSIVLMIVGIILAIIVTFFVEFIFDPNADWREIGVNTILITACTIAVYLLVRYYAMRKGRKTKAWGEAMSNMLDSGKKIIDGDRAKYIPKYCKAWEEDRLNDDITAILAPVGITLEEFKSNYAKLSKAELINKYAVKKKGETSSEQTLTSFQISTILRAKKVKRLKFDERYFYVNANSGRNSRSPSSGLNTKQLNRLTIVRIVMTSLVTSLVSATLFREIIINFSAESIIKCVIKLAIILFFGAIAMMGGYTFTAVKETGEMNAKSDEIEVFLKWCDSEEEKDAAKEPQSLIVFNSEEEVIESEGVSILHG